MNLKQIIVTSLPKQNQCPLTTVPTSSTDLRNNHSRNLSNLSCYGRGKMQGEREWAQSPTISALLGAAKTLIWLTKTKSYLFHHHCPGVKSVESRRHMTKIRFTLSWKFEVLFVVPPILHWELQRPREIPYPDRISTVSPLLLPRGRTVQRKWVVWQNQVCLALGGGKM